MPLGWGEVTGIIPKLVTQGPFGFPTRHLWLRHLWLVGNPNGLSWLVWKLFFPFTRGKPLVKGKRPCLCLSLKASRQSLEVRWGCKRFQQIHSHLHQCAARHVLAIISIIDFLEWVLLLLVVLVSTQRCMLTRSGPYFLFVKILIQIFICTVRSEQSNFVIILRRELPSHTSTQVKRFIILCCIARQFAGESMIGSWRKKRS
jgi:hypothetical protein